ncbi:hypothetical protein TNCV_2442091 [Trichonephila clavipes]|nr:hypothetical protein TNCV_2442091 [Trichonephila clavipes]
MWTTLSIIRSCLVITEFKQDGRTGHMGRNEKNVFLANYPNVHVNLHTFPVARLTRAPELNSRDFCMKRLLSKACNLSNGVESKRHPLHLSYSSCYSMLCSNVDNVLIRFQYIVDQPH